MTQGIVAPEGLLAWLPGEGNANDIAGGNSGVVEGGTFFASTEVNQGFNFDSDDDRVTVANSDNLNVQASGFTVDFWMRGVHDQPQSAFDLVEKSHGFVDGTGWTFQGDSGSGNVGFLIGNGSGFPGVVYAGDLLDGQLHHLAGTWNPADSLIRFYVDGALQGSSPGSPANNNRTMNIGYAWGGGSAQRFFRGAVDEVHVFDRALSDSEIGSIYDAGSAGLIPPPGVSGSVWEDGTNSGVRDAGEPGIPAWSIYVDYNNNMHRDPGEPAGLTASDGSYSIYQVTEGTWWVRQQVETGWTPTLGDQQLTFASGTTNPTANFGNQVPPPRSIGFGKSLAGEISAPGRVSLFNLEVTANELGKPFSIAVDGAPAFRPLLELLSPTGDVLASSGNASNEDALIKDYLLLPTLAGGAGTGTYQIRLTAATAQPGTYELGVSDLPIETPRALPFSTYIAGNIDRLGDEDVYTFVGHAGDVVTLNVSATGFTPNMTVATLTNGVFDIVSGLGNPGSLFTITLTEDTTYFVDVAAAGSGNGPYLLSASNPLPAAQDIQFGQNLPGTVEVPGDAALYHMTVSADQVGKPVSIVVSQRTGDYYFGATVELYGPSGALLASNSKYYYYPSVEIDDFVLPVAGTYTIRVVDDNNTETGYFSLGVSDQPITTPTVLPAFNQTITGSISPIGDVDEYSFSGTSNEVITLQRLSGPVDLTLLGPDGSVVAGSGDYDDFLYKVTLPSDGTYVVRLEPRGGSDYHSQEPDDTGDYSFVVWTPNVTPTPIPIGFGENRPGALVVPGDVVTYSLTVGADQVGKPVSIVISERTPGGNGNTSYSGAVLELLAPDSSVLASNSHYYYYVPVELDDVVLPVAGTYTIRIHDEGSDNETSSFTVGVSDQPVTTPTALPAFNETITGSITPIGDVDEYSFSGTSGELVTLQRLSGPIDLTLFGPDGSVVAGSGYYDDFLYKVMLPANGTYTLRLEPRGVTSDWSQEMDDTGSYSFVVWTPNVTPTPISIGFGESRPGALVVPGDVVTYSLTVGADQVGKPVSIVVSERTPGGIGNTSYSGAVLELLAPDSSVLASNSHYYYYVPVELDDVVLPVAGTYTIRIHDEGSDNETSSFTVGVSDQPVTTPTALPAFNETITGSISPIGDVDEYSFSGTSGELVTLQRLSGPIDLTLLGPDGSVVAGSGYYDDFLSKVMLPANGTYTLRLEPRGVTSDWSQEMDDTGTYSFVVWTPNVTPTPIPIGFGESRPGALVVPGDVVTYSLTAGADQVGKPVSIVVSERTPGGIGNTSYSGAVLELLGPDGSVLASNSTYYYGYAIEIDDFVLPVAGTYTIRVHDEGSDYETSSFAVGVSDQPTEVNFVLGTTISVANGHYFAETSGAQSWTDAEAEAVSWGGHLVSITSFSEQRFLEDFFLSAHPYAHWIGFTDAAAEGVFEWTTGESAIFANWNRPC